MMHITVLAPFDSNRDYTKSVAGAVSCLNQCQDQFRFHVRRWRTEESDFALTRADAERLAESLRAELHLASENFCAAIVVSNLEGNWFSFVSHASRFSFVTLAGCSLFTHFPIEAFLAIEIIQNLQEYLLKWADYSYAHVRPRGCVNDLCGYKRDISLKIQSGYVCPECHSTWKEKLAQQQMEALTAALDRIREVALGRLPVEKPLEEQVVFPVAVIWRLLQQETEPTRRFSRLFDLFDIAVRLSVICLLSDLVSKTKEAPGARPTNLRDFVKERPALGDWVDALPRLFNHLQENPGLSSFDESVLHDVQSAGRFIHQRELVRQRNDTKGHAYTLPPAQYDQLFEKCWPDIDSVIRKLTGVLTIKLLAATRADFKRKQNAYSISGKLLVGSNAIFQQYEFISSRPLEPDEVVFLRPGTDQPVPLLGLIRWSLCPLCAHERVLVSDDEDKYLDPMVGHRVVLADPG